MRKLWVQISKENRQKLLDIAKEQEAINVSCYESNDELVFALSLENRRLGEFIDSAQKLGEVHIDFQPNGNIPLRPPKEEAPDQVVDVSSKSPIEIFLAGLQSIGSWGGFLSYAVAAGVVVWIGLHTNTTFLLTAAMLIAPFGGPAMILAMGTASGDQKLMLRSLARYFAALGVSIVAAYILSMLMGQKVATALTVDRSLLSSVTVLLPLVAGAAGALNLCQSERSSLVSSAATGILVAASLAPPAGVLGMTMAIGEWDMAKSAVYVLLIQLAGINFSGSLVFWLYGLKPGGVRFQRGSTRNRSLSLVISFLAIAGLLTWQFSNQPNLQRATRSQRAVSVIKETLNQSPLASPVKVDAEFTRSNIKGQNSLLIIAYVQKDTQMSDSELKDLLSKKLIDAIKKEAFDVTPLIQLSILSKE